MRDYNNNNNFYNEENSDPPQFNPNLNIQLNNPILNGPQVLANPNLGGVNTLDEPIIQTVKREFQQVIAKTKIAMLPMKADPASLTNDWDLWGPLVFCLILGFILSLQRHDDNSGMVFILVFLVTWLGGLLVSLNSQFLDVELSVTQSISILGYCMFAIVAAACANLFMFFLPTFIKFIIGLGAAGYSTFASYKFISAFAKQSKQYLIVYPIALFYIMLGWFTVAK